MGATPAAPVFTVVKAWTNAAPNEYETEKATYGSNKVKAPKTNDAFAQFNFAIKNDGGTALLKYALVAYSTNKRNFVPRFETVRIIVMERPLRFLSLLTLTNWAAIQSSLICGS